jgi:hypothetical protein
LIEVTAPLWGAFFEGVKPEMKIQETKVHPISSGVGLYYPSFEELNIIKKSSIINVNTVVPLHIKLLYSDNNTVSITHDFLIHAVNLIKDVIYSLRLYKNGWFLNPLFSEVVFEEGNFIQRLPGHYRQAFYYNIDIEPEQHYQYQLSKKDFSKNSKLLKIYRLVSEYRLFSNTSTDIAIENFNDSFGYQLKLVDKLNFLFTSLDAAMGGMSASRIGNVKVKKRFIERLKIIVDYTNLPITPKDLNWFDDSVKGGRAIRNSLAHGKLKNSLIRIAEENFVKMQEIIKYVLIEYINFCTIYSQNPRLITDNFNDAKANSFCGIFNKVLEKCIADEHKKQIMSSISFNQKSKRFC